MSLCDVMSINIVTVPPATDVAAIARTMVETKVGSALVCDGPRLLGIITERDILRMVAQGRDLAEMRGDECMTAGPVCAGPDWEIDDAARLMVSRGIRHLPVTQDGLVAGMVSMRDLVRFGAAAVGHGHERGREILEVVAGREVIDLDAVAAPV